MIVVVYPQLSGVGGIARYIESWLSNISPEAEKVLVIHGGGAVRLKPRLGVELLHVPMPEGRLGLAIWTYRVRQVLKRLTREGAITAINFHAPPLIPAFGLPGGIPLTITAHTTYYGMSGQFLNSPLFPSSWGPLSVSLKKLIERWLFGRASRIIALTEQGRAEVLHYGYEGPISVIPNGVDLSNFSNAAGPAVEKDIDVIFPGRIEPRKGSKAIPPILERLVTADPGIKVAVVGYGEDQETVATLARRFPENIAFTGQVPFPEMVNWLRRSKTYAAPSFYEGLPGTCVEAMAMSLPVVVWDMQFYDGLVDNGVNGVRVKPGDFDGFAGAVISLLRSNDIEAMGEAARERAISSYNWAELADQITVAINAE